MCLHGFVIIYYDQGTNVALLYLLPLFVYPSQFFVITIYSTTTNHNCLMLIPSFIMGGLWCVTHLHTRLLSTSCLLNTCSFQCNTTYTKCRSLFFSTTTNLDKWYHASTEWVKNKYQFWCIQHVLQVRSKPTFILCDNRESGGIHNYTLITVL